MHVLTKLPGFKSADSQGVMWDRPLTGHGSCRALIGDFAETLTARLLRGKRYRTDSRCKYCPDVYALGSWFEVKAAGRNHETFVYAGRLEKDRRFAADHNLFYVIWHHRARTLTADSREDLQRLFLWNLQAVYVVPFAVIDEVAAAVTATPLNSKYGKSDTNPTYGSGYRLPIKRLAQSGCLTIDVQIVRELF